MNLCAIVPVLAQTTDAAAPDSQVLEWWIATGVIVLLLAVLWVFDYKTRAGIIARATVKETVRQPVFWFLLIVLTLLPLIVYAWLPVFTLGEDLKSLKENGLATILVWGLALAVWTSSTSIATEIEGKTTMTLLSKPINRRQFIVGKYFGILQGVMWFMLPACLAFLALIYYKVGYDARESGGADVPQWFEFQRAWGWLPVPTGERWAAVMQILPPLLLVFLEIAVLTAVSVAISTRAPMVINLVTMLVIFAVGHLTPVLVRSVFQRVEFVKFMAQLIATVLPSLEMFDAETTIATESIVPAEYVGVSALYAAAYCAAAVLLAFLLFEDRDLA